MAGIIVICEKCGNVAPVNPPDPEIGMINWDTTTPCQRCGALQWGAHDLRRDPKTGKLLDKYRDERER